MPICRYFIRISDEILSMLFVNDIFMCVHFLLSSCVSSVLIFVMYVRKIFVLISLSVVVFYYKMSATIFFFFLFFYIYFSFFFFIIISFFFVYKGECGQECFTICFLCLIPPLGCVWSVNFNEYIFLSLIKMLLSELFIYSCLVQNIKVSFVISILCFYIWALPSA